MLDGAAYCRIGSDRTCNEIRFQFCRFSSTPHFLHSCFRTALFLLFLLLFLPSSLVCFHQFLIFRFNTRLHPLALTPIVLLIYQSSQMQTIKWNQNTTKRPTTETLSLHIFHWALFRAKLEKMCHTVCHLHRRAQRQTPESESIAFIILLSSAFNAIRCDAFIQYFPLPCTSHA